MYSSFNLGDQT
jgi:uncharacterized membrane protein